MLIKEFTFIDKSTQTGYTEEFSNVNGRTLTIQVITEGSCSFNLEGDMGIDAENFTPITGVKMADLTLVNSGVKGAGIYEYDITGLRTLRLNVTNTTNELTVKGVITND